MMTTINSLTPDCFYHILNYLSIDERIALRLIFPQFKESFKKIYTTSRQTKCIGLDSINIDSSNVSLSIRKFFSKYYLYYRWNCSMIDKHRPTSSFFSSNNAMKEPCNKCGKQIILCVLKRCEHLEALDLRGTLLTTEIISYIITYCPRLTCLQLNFSSFESKEAQELYTTQLAPRLKHMTCDSLLFGKEQTGSFIDMLFHSTLLEETDIILLPGHNIRPNDFSFFNENLTYLNLHFFRGKRDTSPPPHEIISAISSGPSRNIEYIKIRTNYQHVENFNILNKLSSFQNLKALNLSFMNYHLTTKDFNIEQCWPVLESLTVDFYSLRGSNDLMSLFFSGEYNSNLKNLRIIDCHLKKDTIKKLSTYFPNLTKLYFFDISISNIDVVFQSLLKLEHLKLLRIEYTIQDYNHDVNSMSQLVNTYRFQAENIDKLVYFIEHHPSLQKLYLIDWPGLKSQDLTKVYEMAKTKNILFHHEEY